MTCSSVLEFFLESQNEVCGGAHNISLGSLGSLGEVLNCISISPVAAQTRETPAAGTGYRYRRTGLHVLQAYFDILGVHRPTLRSPFNLFRKIIMQVMKNTFASPIAYALVSACLALALAATSLQAQAQSEASALSAVSALPVASVVLGTSAVAGAVLAVPVALSTAGSVLVVKTVESSARGTLCVLERVSVGARASIEITGRGMAQASVGVGTVVAVSAIGAGMVLSAAGEAIAFIPNELGRALLHNERITH